MRQGTEAIGSPRIQPRHGQDSTGSTLTDSWAGMDGVTGRGVRLTGRTMMTMTHSCACVTWKVCRLSWELRSFWFPSNLLGSHAQPDSHVTCGRAGTACLK